MDALLDDVDILFGNEAEALGICATDDLGVAIGRLAVGRARFKELEIDRLTVRHLKILEP